MEKELLKPKIDVVFHALFREENKNLTEALISDILGEKVKVITSDRDRHLNIKDPEQKFGIMDLRTELEGGVKCNIEVQVEEVDFETERFLYYWADAYSRQLEKGTDYDILHKTISIIILDHELKELKDIEELGTKWQIRDEKTGKRLLTNHLEIIIIEIPKARRIYKKNNTTYADIVSSEKALVYWCLQYGESVELLTPKETRNKIKEKIEIIYNKYG